ncbi:MAG: hypothetical protein LBM93_03930 [Oscillospiraceae bacterium]|nr:hypothetical protein [Oscillospiraceae bacterium]
MDAKSGFKIVKTYIAHNYLFFSYVVIAFLVIVIVSVVNFLSSKNETYETVKAEYITYTDVLDFTAVIVREEQILSFNKNDYMSYLFTDGTKIGKDTAGFTQEPVQPVIAVNYGSKYDFNNAVTRTELQNKIAELTFDRATKEQANFSNLSATISKDYQRLISMIADKDFENITSVEDELTKSLNVKSFILSGDNTFDLIARQYNSELAGVAVSTPENVYAPIENAGYFCSKTDGLESLLNAEKLKTADTSQLIDLFDTGKSTIQSDSYVGKVITDYRYKILTCVPSEKLNGNFDIKENEKVTLQINTEQISAVIESIQFYNNQAVLVFGSDEKISNFSSQRSYLAKIIGPTYTGLKVPKDAVRPRGYTKNGEEVEYKGVWVKIGESNSYRKIVCSSEELQTTKELQEEQIMLNEKSVKTQEEKDRLAQISDELNKLKEPILFGYGNDDLDYLIINAESQVSGLSPHSRVIIYGKGYDDAA